MTLKYDNAQINRIVAAFAETSDLQDRKGLDYSMTARKRIIAREEGLRGSDIDRILYGTELFVEGISEVEKLGILSVYNSGESSVRKIAKSNGISTAKLYRVLNEMDKQEGQDVSWRGQPKVLANYHAGRLEDVVEPATIKTHRRGRGIWPRVAAAVVFGALTLYAAKSAAEYAGSKAVDIVRGRETKQVHVVERLPGHVFVIKGSEMTQKSYGLEESLHLGTARILDTSEEIADEDRRLLVSRGGKFIVDEYGLKDNSSEPLGKAEIKSRTLGKVAVHRGQEFENEELGLKESPSRLIVKKPLKRNAANVQIIRGDKVTNETLWLGGGILASSN